MDQVAQAARRLATGWTARVRKGGLFFTPSCPGVHSASYKMSTVLATSVGLATLPLPSAVALYMWALASTSTVAFMACNGDNFNFIYGFLYNMYNCM